MDFVDLSGLSRFKDKLETLFAKASHKHSAADVTSGTLPVARGGTGVTSNPSLLVNLGSTAAAGVFAASPRPGVTGTLPVARGGTGATSAAAARTALGITPANIGAAASSHTHAASQVTGLTASRALVSDASGHPAASAVTATELGYLDGVTGAIQAQLNGKAASSHSHAAATASAAGLMSAADKSKLDGITRITETEIDALFAS